MKYCYMTDTGKVRDHNEDSVVITENLNKEILMTVADGMGGHNAGEVASSLAITHIGKRFRALSTIGNKEDAVNWLRETVNDVNELINNYAVEHPESAGMGTTLVLALVTKDFLLFGNIGDSSGYVFKNSNLQKITINHTLVNMLVKSGELTEEEAKNHPRKNVLMRALGSSKNVELDIFDVDPNIDGIFLCSDGLTNMLDDEQIAKVLTENLSIEEKLLKLIYKCNNRGGNDNISVAYLEKGGK